MYNTMNSWHAQSNTLLLCYPILEQTQHSLTAYLSRYGLYFVPF